MGQNQFVQNGPCNPKELKAMKNCKQEMTGHVYIFTYYLDLM